MSADLNRKTLNISEVDDSQPKLIGSKENILAELKLGEKKEISLNPSISTKTNKTPCSSPNDLESSPKGFGLPVPHKIITKRTRTHSTNERAMKNPEVKGKIKYFSRTKGHGFVESEDGEEIFLHISDIEGEYVPKVGDEVVYRLCPIPPKDEKYQATHVRIINFVPEVHMKWDASPLYSDEKSSECHSDDN